MIEDSGTEVATGTHVARIGRDGDTVVAVRGRSAGATANHGRRGHGGRNRVRGAVLRLETALEDQRRADVEILVAAAARLERVRAQRYGFGGVGRRIVRIERNPGQRRPSTAVDVTVRRRRGQMRHRLVEQPVADDQLG